MDTSELVGLILSGLTPATKPDQLNLRSRPIRPIGQPFLNTEISIDTTSKRKFHSLGCEGSLCFPSRFK
jgi:hypothetical protein